MEIKCVVALVYLVNEGIKLHDSPLVKLCKLAVGNHICIGVESAKISENISCSVSDLLISVRKLAEDRLGDSDIAVVVRRSYPETEDIRAVLLGYLARVDTVAERLVHGLALAVNYPAVSADSLVRSRTLVNN